MIDTPSLIIKTTESEEIQRQIDAFLKSGGTIRKCYVGESGEKEATQTKADKDTGAEKA